MQPRAQQRLYELRPQPLRQMHEWLQRYRELWDARFAEMDDVLKELTEKEQRHGRKKNQ